MSVSSKSPNTPSTPQRLLLEAQSAAAALALRCSALEAANAAAELAAAAARRAGFATGAAAEGGPSGPAGGEGGTQWIMDLQAVRDTVEASRQAGDQNLGSLQTKLDAADLENRNALIALTERLELLVSDWRGRDGETDSGLNLGRGTGRFQGHREYVVSTPSSGLCICRARTVACGSRDGLKLLREVPRNELVQCAGFVVPIRVFSLDNYRHQGRCTADSLEADEVLVAVFVYLCVCIPIYPQSLTLHLSATCRQAGDNVVLHESTDAQATDLVMAAEDISLLVNQIQLLQRAARQSDPAVAASAAAGPATEGGSDASGPVPAASTSIQLSNFATWAALMKAVKQLESNHMEVQKEILELDTRVQDRMTVSAQVIVKVGRVFCQ